MGSIVPLPGQRVALLGGCSAGALHREAKRFCTGVVQGPVISEGAVTPPRISLQGPGWVTTDLRMCCLCIPISSPH